MYRYIPGLMAAAIVGNSFMAVTPAKAAKVSPPQAQAETPIKPHAQASGPTLEMTRLFLQMSKYSKAGDTAGVIATLKDMVSHPDFDGLFIDMRRDLYIQLAYYQFDQQAYTDAEATLDKAGALKGTPMTAGYWLMRSDLAMMTDKKAESVAAFTQLARQFPDELSKYRPGYVFNRVHMSQALSDKAAYRNLLIALKVANYTPGGTATAEDLWFDLIEVHVAAGETEKAAAIARDLKTAYPLIRLRIDKRYSGLRHITDADIDTALEYELDRYRQAIKDEPQKFDGPLRLAEELLEQNRSAAALAILDTELSKIDNAPKAETAFDDQKELHAWGLNTRSQLLHQLGRHAEAEKALIRAQQIARSYDAETIAYVINLAAFYNSFSRPKDALKTVGDIDIKTASPYGRLAAEAVQVCAYAQLGETAKLKASLDQMMTSESAATAYLPLQLALSCAGDGDRLAAVIIAQLDNPQTRNDALLSLQAYQDAPGSSPRGLAINAFYKQTIARDDVQSAVKKYGDIISLPLIRVR